jgi:hypothetical protein
MRFVEGLISQVNLTILPVQDLRLEVGPGIMLMAHFY